MALALEKRLENVRQEEAGILESINERNKRKKIKCEAESCGKFHPIQNLTLIQTYRTVFPKECDVYQGVDKVEDEMQFRCPGTGVINRLKFGGRDVEKQFKINYGSYFRKIIEGTQITHPPWENNYYVDKNRKKFGLVEKRTSEKD